MIKRLWTWLAGYVVVKFKGANLEVLINRIGSQDYSLWDIQRVSRDIIIGKLPIRQFKKLRPLLIGLNIRISIIGKSGLPFLIRRALQRKFLFIGVVGFGLVLYYLSGFIWFIEIDGCEKVCEKDIKVAMANEHVVVGARKSSLNNSDLENLLLVTFPEFSWVGVNSKGVLLTVQVVERTTPSAESLQHGDLIAKRGGLITQILSSGGTVQVNVGDTVKKGELLIAGEYYDRYGKRQQGQAEGIVRARVWYDAIGEASYSKINQIFTGNTHVNYTISLGNRSFNWGKKVPFLLYTVDSSSWQQQIKNYRLPLTITTHRYEEVHHEIVPVLPELAKDLALERAWQDLHRDGIEKEHILDSQIKEYSVADQYGIRIGLIVEVEENIADFKALD